MNIVDVYIIQLYYMMSFLEGGSYGKGLWKIGKYVHGARENSWIFGFGPTVKEARSDLTKSIGAWVARAIRQKNRKIVTIKMPTDDTIGGVSNDSDPSQSSME